MPTIALPYRTRIASEKAVVQLEYPADAGPLPKPESDSPHWTRFVLLSDTHTTTFSVPDGDVLIHTGDLTNFGTVQELETTMEWLYALPHRLKIVIAGNHDLAVHRDWYEANWKRLPRHSMYSKPVPAAAILKLLKGPRARAANIVYLQDEEYKFTTREGGREWSVYGSPWSPKFYFWAFAYEREDGEALVSKFPKTDILLTHGPPCNILDYTNNDDRAGCDDLAERVQELKPRLHVFGHIHEARGVYLHRWKRDAEFGAQNAIQLGIAEDGTESEEYEESDEFGPTVVDKADEGVGDALEDTTVFVNAANLPSGPHARRMRNRPGGKAGDGFQPIVVDLHE